MRGVRRAAWLGLRIGKGRRRDLGGRWEHGRGGDRRGRG
jgi:hypothetical protein